MSRCIHYLTEDLASFRDLVTNPSRCAANSGTLNQPKYAGCSASKLAASVTSVTHSYPWLPMATPWLPIATPGYEAMDPQASPLEVVHDPSGPSWALLHGGLRDRRLSDWRCP